MQRWRCQLPAARTFHWLDGQAPPLVLLHLGLQHRQGRGVTRGSDGPDGQPDRSGRLAGVTAGWQLHMRSTQHAARSTQPHRRLAPLLLLLLLSQLLGQAQLAATLPPVLLCRGEGQEEGPWGMLVSVS